MDAQEEKLPELFRIDYYSQFFIGELVHSNLYETRSFSGFIQIFEMQVVLNAPTKRKIIDIAEEMCIMLLEIGIHYDNGRTIKILKTNLYIN